MVEFVSDCRWISCSKEPLLMTKGTSITGSGFECWSMGRSRLLFAFRHHKLGVVENISLDVVQEIPIWFVRIIPWCKEVVRMCFPLAIERAQCSIFLPRSFIGLSCDTLACAMLTMCDRHIVWWTKFNFRCSPKLFWLLMGSNPISHYFICAGRRACKCRVTLSLARLLKAYYFDTTYSYIKGDLKNIDLWFARNSE